MNIINNNRFKSLCWRSVMMILAGGLSFLAENLTSLELSQEMVVFAGLVLGEISKLIMKNVR